LNNLRRICFEAGSADSRPATSRKRPATLKPNVAFTLASILADRLRVIPSRSAWWAKVRLYPTWAPSVMPSEPSTSDITQVPGSRHRSPSSSTMCRGRHQLFVALAMAVRAPVSAVNRWTRPKNCDPATSAPNEAEASAPSGWLALALTPAFQPHLESMYRESGSAPSVKSSPGGMSEGRCAKARAGSPNTPISLTAPAEGWKPTVVAPALKLIGLADDALTPMRPSGMSPPGRSGNGASVAIALNTSVSVLMSASSIATELSPARILGLIGNLSVREKGPPMFLRFYRFAGVGD
jgi:hypothetical protein